MAKNYKFQNIESDVKKGFLDGVPVRIQSCVKERSSYIIEVAHGIYEWTIEKTQQDFTRLNKALSKPRWGIIGTSNKVAALPIFIDDETDQSSVVKYLEQLLENGRSNEHVKTFFNLSKFSFVEELGEKGIEGLITLHADPDEVKQLCSFLWCLFTDVECWCVLKETCMIILDKKTQKIHGVVQIDQEFSIETDSTRIEIRNSNLRLKGYCETVQQAEAWKHFAEKIIAKDKWKIIQSNDFGAFSPSRMSRAQWLVDGHAYFQAVADAMDQAEEQIFITDWMISPSIHLKRTGVKDRLYWRLDNVLKRKAEQGVRIYLMVYKEVPGTVANFSRDAEEYLTSLNRNIQVILHPEFSLKSVLWSHHEKLVIIDQKIAFVGGIDFAFNRYDLSSHPLSDEKKDSQGFHRWVGKDYNNLYDKDRLNYGDKSEKYDAKYRQTHARTPWHDVSAVIYGESARDVSRHFIQRWNFFRYETKATENIDMFHLIPKAFDKETFELIDSRIIPNPVEVKVQVLRSSSEWSTGHKGVEKSIHEAYIKLIQNSKKYVYIENQYFISNREETENKIVSALFNRILKASENNETFRVYVVLPLLPSAENDIRYDSKSQTIQTLLGFQYRSINREEGSLMFDLEKHGVEVDKYISFCALRSKSTVNGTDKTGILYVHSKLMIVDDRVAILGSANINERSLLGDRDSEVDILVEDTEIVSSTMGGEEFPVGVFSSILRKRCFAEHCGLLPADYNEENIFEPTINIDDIVSDEFFENIWKKIARENTFALEKVFKCAPSDNLKKFGDEAVKKFEEGKLTDKIEIQEELKKVQGHLVQFPLRALEDEDLRPDRFTKERLLPDDVFV